MTRSRIHELDTAKALAILLVVYGHIVATDTLVGNDWYWNSKVTIYMFHMPFFMFISGIVAGVSYPAIASFGDYRAYVTKKFWRLVPAYLLFAVIVLAGKMIGAHFVKVDNPAGSSILDGLAAIVISPRDSPAEYLWFIYILFLYYLSLPLLVWLVRGRFWLLPLIGLAAQLIPAGTAFAMDRYCYHLLFFLGGYAFGRDYARVAAVFDRGSVLWWLLFGFALWWAQPPDFPNLWVALASVPALMSLSRLPALQGVPALGFIARMAFPIYLMNTMAIGVVKGISLKFLDWNGSNFYFYMVWLMLGGLLLPIFVKRYIICHFPRLSRITD
jgi:fucose 4-O-acetylase-like acetyltransferase